MWGLALIEMTFRTEKEDREFLYDSANKKEKQICQKHREL